MKQIKTIADDNNSKQAGQKKKKKKNAYFMSVLIPRKVKVNVLRNEKRFLNYLATKDILEW